MLTAKRLVGTNVNVVLSVLKLTVPETFVPPADKVTELFPTLDKASGALNTAFTRTFTCTPVVPFGGLTVTTVGAVVTAPNAVVNKELNEAKLWPSRSAIALVGKTLYNVAGAKGALGVSVAVKPSVETEIVPATGIDGLFGAKLNVDAVTVIGSICLLNRN